jgi:hypothetical protein
MYDVHKDSYSECLASEFILCTPMFCNFQHSISKIIQTFNSRYEVGEDFDKGFSFWFHSSWNKLSEEHQWGYVSIIWIPVFKFVCNFAVETISIRMFDNVNISQVKIVWISSFNLFNNGVVNKFRISALKCINATAIKTFLNICIETCKYFDG